MNFSLKRDRAFLRQALKLAKKGLSWTSPNPMVGAVLVKNDQVIGRGFHHQVGGPHAEIKAINNAGRSLKGATLYVNLEPCVHYGKTPPCVNSIIKAGINRIVCSTLDPNPKVAGQGIKQLKKAGLKTQVGVLKKSALKLNEAFITFHQKKHPFIAIKFASSLDGKTATIGGDSRWITNRQSRNFARSLRGYYQSILVGINTVLADNPHLGLRNKNFKDPTRIVLDSHLQIPLTAKLFRDSNVIIAATQQVNIKKQKQLLKLGVRVLNFPGSNIPLKRLLTKLKGLGIISVLVEGGSQILTSFIDNKLVDKVYAFHAPIIIGNRHPLSNVLALDQVNFQSFAADKLTTGYIK